MKLLYRRRFVRLASISRFAHLSDVAALCDRGTRDGVMLFYPKHEERLGRLEEKLRRAQTVTPQLMSDVVAQACGRFATHSGAASARVDRLIGSGAWTDAAVTLVELELPQWKLRRLIYEDGEWHCSLSKQPTLPAGLDETAEASHEILPLATLIAFIEALREILASREPLPRTVPPVQPAQGYPVCCDNFA